MTFEWPFTGPSPNVKEKRIITKQRRDKIKNHLHSELFDLGEIPRFTMKVKFTYHRYSNKRLDRDGLYASAKYFIDAFTWLGIIPDDTEDHIDLICENKKGKPRTVVMVEAL